jgi:uncharacterized protein (TIGR01777 family)
MRVAVTGASGLIGRALTQHLARSGHDPVPFARPGDWDPERGWIDLGKVRSCDAVVHLAGVGIADSRWTDDQKRAIRESRTVGTDLIARTLADLEDGPRILVSGSAVGWYGDTGERSVSEGEPAATDFVASIVQDWEAAAHPAVAAGVRVAFCRTSQVLSTDGGPLAKQLPFFKLGLGGRVGSGRQWMTWISIDDEVRAIEWLLTHDLSGPVNLAAPEPVRNGDFAKALGRALHRPTFVIPTVGPQLLYGRELVEVLLLISQRVEPRVLLESGFEFRHPTLDAALADLLR